MEGWKPLGAVRQDAASWGDCSETNFPPGAHDSDRCYFALGCLMYGKKPLLVASGSVVGRQRGKQSVG